MVLIQFRRLSLAVLSALLVACGGGGEQSSSGDGGRPLASAAAASPSDASDLMASFERKFPQYFPSSQPNRNAPPFVFRFYPETGIYLAVVTFDGTSFIRSGVYVLGGPFGTSPRYIGQLSEFMPVSTPSPGTSDGSTNGCFDLALTDTPGNVIEVSYKMTPKYGNSPPGTLKVTQRIGAMTTFAGQNARESEIVTVGTMDSSGVAGPINDSYRSYARRDGTQLTRFGTLRSSVNGSSTDVTQGVFTEPYVDRRTSVQVGESYLDQYRVVYTTTVTNSTGVFQTTSSTPSSATTKYAARESLTLPAGTFLTCRFEQTNNFGLVTKHWLLAGSGISLKVDTAGSTMEATAITINGAAP